MLLTQIYLQSKEVYMILLFLFVVSVDIFWKTFSVISSEQTMDCWIDFPQGVEWQYNRQVNSRSPGTAVRVLEAGRKYP